MAQSTMQDLIRSPEGTAFAEPAAGPALGAAGTLALFARHLLCFVLPVTTLAYLVTAPHSLEASLAMFAVLPVSVIIDTHAGRALHQPSSTLPGWPFDGVLYLLSAFHLVAVALFVHHVATVPTWTLLGGFDVFLGFLLLGVNSGYSGIVVAHELIHRNKARFQWLGRLLLVSVLYEHFFTEHVRGHHARVGTADDPATSRFGERFEAFFRRTVPAQFASAWRIESKRLGDEAMHVFDVRQLGNRVLHGVIAEVVVLVAVGALGGWLGVVAFVAQAVTAVRLLEAVNYFEHYGLSRRTKRIRPIDSWDTDSWFTLFTLVGLSRHADHHAFASRPYQKLRHWEESPKLPRGYFGMVVLALLRNRKFMRLMEQELRAKKLGPFEEAASP